MESDKVNIIDYSGEQFNKISIPYPFFLVLIVTLVLINIFLLIPGSFISVFVSLIILFLCGIFYYYNVIKNPGIRKFSISMEEIEINIPNMPFFIIYWSEFKKIEIKLIELNSKPFTLYEVHFINHNSERVFKLSLSEFHKEKLDQILLLLKEYAKKMKKEFSAVKETMISGVYLVENLDL
ncbi:MAG: hypothetical protein ACFE75_08320 [Candidatus Hodarchaeota archaeon]